jgi:hypothetical protein
MLWEGSETGLVTIVPDAVTVSATAPAAASINAARNVKMRVMIEKFFCCF